MRKFTYLFALLGMFLFSANLYADESGKTIIDKNNPWITDASQLYSPYNEPGRGEPGIDIGGEGHLENMIDGKLDTYWSSDWHNAPTEYGVHYVQATVEAKNVTEKFVFQWASRGDANKNNGSYNAKMSLYGAPSEDATKDECTLLCVYTAPAQKYGVLNMSDPILSQGFNIFRWYIDEAFVLSNNKKAYVLQFSELQMFPMVEKTDRELALDTLNQTYNKYIGYLGTFDIGTNPGQYSQEKYDAFEEAVLAADPENPELETKTIDEIRQMTKDMNDTYTALQNSRVKMQPFSTGYYYVANYYSFDDGYTKGLYDNDGTLGWNSMEEGNCKYLWYVEYKGQDYVFYNCAFNRCISSSPKNGMQFEENLDPVKNQVYMPLYKYDEQLGNIVALRSQHTSDGYGYFHAGGHQAGAGVSGNVIGWRGGADSEMSYWYFIPVDSADAAQIIEDFQPIRDRKAMLEDLHRMESESRLALARAHDSDGEVDYSTGLITDASQLSSKFSDSSEGKNMGNLLDGDVATYWHSNWHGGTVAPGTQSFEVTFDEALEDGFGFNIMRRTTTGNDHPIKIEVYGAKTNAEPYTWTYLSTPNIPFSGCGSAANPTVDKSDIVFFSGRYKAFKFVVTETQAANRGFFHMAEFQMYPVVLEENPNSQFSKMGKIATDLEDIVNALPDNDDDVTTNDYLALKAAYEAFFAVFVDPTPLREVLRAAKTKQSVLVEGTNPGFWSEAVINEYNGLVDDADEYDAEGEYVQATSDAYKTQLTEAAGTIMGKCNKIQEGKWYYMSFPTEEMYETYGWDKTPAAAQTPEEGYTKNQPLFGKYVVHGENSWDGHENHFVPVETEDIVLDDFFFYADESEIIPDQAMFRFVNLGDTAYAIQNKASGLYIQLYYNPERPGTGGNVRAALTPSAATLEAVGCGANIIYTRPYDNAFNCCLHAALDRNTLVTWTAYTIGSNSCLMLTEAEDVDPEYEAPAINISAKVGAFYSFCVATPVALAEDSPASMYTAKMSTEKENTVVLYPIEKADAGVPFYYIDGAPEDYDEESPVTETFQIIAGTTFAPAPVPYNDMIGCYYVGKRPAGSMYADNNTFKVVSSETTSSHNSAYVNANITPTSPGMYPEVGFEISTETGIADALSKVARPNSGIYTLDGKRIATGNLNTLKTLPAGSYIINGIKVNK